MESFRVVIVVLNYNGKDCLEPCLKSLLRQSYENKKIIVVDNGSNDSSFDEAERKFPELSFVRNGKNLGFAAGMNKGMEKALDRGADAVWLMNNDAIAEPGCLEALVRKAQSNPRAGLLSPIILKKDTEEVWFAGGKINYLRMRAEHVSRRPVARTDKPYTSQFLTGCALFATKKTLETAGFLDEDFFLYYEDADWCLRAWQKGLECYVVPDARVHHAEKSRFNPEKTYHLVLSGLRFFDKWTPGYLVPYMALYVTIRRIKNSIDMFLRRQGAEAVHKAYGDYFRKSPSRLDHHR